MIAAPNIVTFSPTFRKWCKPMHAPILQRNEPIGRAHHQDGLSQHGAMKQLGRISSRYLMVPRNNIPTVSQPPAVRSRRPRLSINLGNRELPHARV